MIEGKAKQDVLKRLDRVEGQVRGIKKMITEDRYCMEVLIQTRAVAAAVKQAELKVLEAHLKSCVVTSFESGSDDERHEKIAEILTIFKKYNGGKG